MPSDAKQQLLRSLPSVANLLTTPQALQWLVEHPRELVTQCLRQALDDLRQAILADQAGHCGAAHVGEPAILSTAGDLLADKTAPQIAHAINATGIILHTGLGRAVWPEAVVDDLAPGLKGYVTLAIDRETGLRSERHNRIEPIFRELTGAQGATVVNNNAGATLLALAALGAGKEVIVSRGELIEIGGSFRLPDVMAASGCKMVEVGTTNRTHLRDYERSITENTAVIFRAHPSNYRIVGFTSRPELAELVQLAHSRGVALVDDLGAGALVDLELFGLPHEPTIGESIAAGADLVLASTDKLIGASQGGAILGTRELVQKCRKHPLARALRIDKSCLMALERTLMLFRDVERLKRDHPTYRMLCQTPATLEARAKALADAIVSASIPVEVSAGPSVSYLGSGSLPMEQLPSFAVRLRTGAMKTPELARRLRIDAACVFGHIEDDALVLDMRTVCDVQLPAIVAAIGRSVQ